MLCVFFAHFTLHYFQADSAQLARAQLFTMVASPSFMLVSGMVSGFLYHTRGEGFKRFRVKLVDRGLFLLIVAHGLIGISRMYITQTEGISAAFRVLFITDAIGFSIIVGPMIISRVRMIPRVLLGAGILAGSWWMFLSFVPQSFAVRFAAETLWGVTGPQIFSYSFPFLPWLAVYLMGSGLGEQLSRYYQAGRQTEAVLFLFKVGVLGVMIATASKVTYWLLKWKGLVSPGEIAYQLTTPLQKLPPGPVYVLFYGGLGVMMVGSLFLMEQKDAGRWLRRELSVLGRTSLFLFVLQYFVYYTGFGFLRLPYSPWWPLYLALSVILMWRLAHFWLSAGYNRFITVGYAHFRESRHFEGVTTRS